MGASCSTFVEDAIEDRKLSKCTATNTLRFIPEVRRARVVSIYDGDTITVAARLKGRSAPFLFKVRLQGIDAPEIRGGSAEEKQSALVARDFLRERALNKPVTLGNVETEKYGRLLASVKLRGKDLSQLMLERGYAQPYDGGTKVPFVAPLVRP